MNHQRSKNISTSESMNCERFLSRLLRQEKQNNLLPYKKASKTAEKFPITTAIITSTRNATIKHQQQNKKQGANNPIHKPPFHATVTNSPPTKDWSPERNGIKDAQRLKPRSVSQEKRTKLATPSGSETREPWSSLLIANMSKDNINSSTFNSFDPLRTLHFLAKELQSKVSAVFTPDDTEVQQIVHDIQIALKRIPPEVASIVHLKSSESVLKAEVTKDSPANKPECPNDEVQETLLRLHQPVMVEKAVQTPPAINKEDQELLQRVMEESTMKLEASCQQFETLCSNLQRENEDLERALNDEKNHTQSLNKQIKSLEMELNDVTTGRMKQLELENSRLQEELIRITGDSNNNPTTNQWKCLADELKIQKTAVEQKFKTLQYELTLMTMEKEKYSMMLSIRDEELKEIQKEMVKIQEEVCKHLTTLNGHITRTPSENIISKPSSTEKISRATRFPTAQITKASKELDKENLTEFGDVTISSLISDDCTKRDGAVAPTSFKELPSGDCSVLQESQDNVTAEEKNIEEIFSVKKGVSNFRLVFDDKDPAAVIEALLDEMMPICNAVLS